MIGNRTAKRALAAHIIKISNLEGPVQTCHVINVDRRSPIYDAEMASGAVKRVHPVSQGSHDVVYAVPRMYQDRL